MQVPAPLWPIGGFSGVQITALEGTAGKSWSFIIFGVYSLFALVDEGGRARLCVRRGAHEFEAEDVGSVWLQRVQKREAEELEGGIGPHHGPVGDAALVERSIGVSVRVQREAVGREER